jgi:hypothetical protein
MSARSGADSSFPGLISCAPTRRSARRGSGRQWMFCFLDRNALYGISGLQAFVSFVSFGYVEPIESDPKVWDPGRPTGRVVLERVRPGLEGAGANLVHSNISTVT